eukprot:jgi/Mesvir1/2046/Mv14789-RA.1
MERDAHDDGEMLRLCATERAAALERLAALEEEALHLLLPHDPVDSRGSVLEVRAGTGGDEAALFAMELFRMYERYAGSRGWRFEVVDIAVTEGGGCKEASAEINGHDVFRRLKHESGVHRVQRVPATEAKGRVHTSAASVAILPLADEVDVELRDEDIRVDVYRSGGAGGQSVNTTNSAVRVTHIPTGLVVAIQDERSQHKNKSKAIKVLRARLFDAQRTRQAEAEAAARHEQIGTGDRSERIRTYNFPQGRVTDHRVGLTVHDIPSLMAGEGLDDIIDALLLKEKATQIMRLQNLEE